jgi:Cu/Ag efflux protein CusF
MGHVRLFQRLRGFGVCVALAVSLASCGSAERHDTPPSADSPASTQPPPASVSRHKLQGKVVSVDLRGKRLQVDHDAIPGFMSAMTMFYPVKDSRAIEGLKAGQPIAATVVVSGGTYWLEDIVPNRER